VRNQRHLQTSARQQTKPQGILAYSQETMPMMGKQIVCATGILVLSCLCGIGVEYYVKESAAQGLGATSGLGFVQQKVQQSHKAMKEEHEEEEVERKIQQTHTAKEKHEEDQRKVGQTHTATKDNWPAPAPWYGAPSPADYSMPAPAPAPWYGAPSPADYSMYPPAPADYSMYPYSMYPAPSPADYSMYPAPSPADYSMYPAPSPADYSMYPDLIFHVPSGSSCKVDRFGCVTSPSYPGHYSNNERCNITASGKGTFSAVDFQTERWYDKLFIMEDTYDGSNGPSKISPAAKNGGSLNIAWVSDYSVTDRGWKLCPEPVGTPEPVRTPGPGRRVVVGREGQTCDDACSEAEMQCSHQALEDEALFSEFGIRAAAESAGWNCTQTKSWSYEGNPGICTNHHCCGDGSCTGLCAYGHSGRSNCWERPAGHYSRICPCESISMVGH